MLKLDNWNIKIIFFKSLFFFNWKLATGEIKKAQGAITEKWFSTHIEIKGGVTIISLG